MRQISVWAYHSDFGTLCRNASLDKPGKLQYPAANNQGQAGWHVAIRFESIADLAKSLSAGVPMPRQFCGNRWDDCDPIGRGEIARLAMMAHGDQGGVWMANGKKRGPVTAADLKSMHADLNTIGLFTNEQSTIMLMGCLSGQGLEGSKLLKGLSQIWTHRTIVAFTTLGYRHPGAMSRTGEPCELPGMRDTDASADLYKNPNKWDSQWSDQKALPWASEGSPHAKIVKDGAILRCPNDELCVDPAMLKKTSPKPPHRKKKAGRF